MRVRAAIAIAMVTACARHQPSACPQRAPTGAWKLRTINGAPLPFVLSQSERYKMETVDVTLDARADGRFVIRSHMRESMDGKSHDQTSPDSGSYALSDSTMTLRFDSDGKTSVLRAGCDTWTMQERGGMYVFVR